MTEATGWLMLDGSGSGSLAKDTDARGESVLGLGSLSARCPVSVFLSDDLRLSWEDAKSIEKMILRCLKQPGFL
jgi:hypothetical protein